MVDGMRLIPLIGLLSMALLGACQQYAYVPVPTAYPGYPQPDLTYNRPVYQTPVGVMATTVAYPIPQPVVAVPVQTTFVSTYPVGYWGWRPYRPWAYPNVRWEVCC